MSGRIFPLRVYFSPGYAADIGDHVMPMRKFALVSARLRDEPGMRLLEPEPVDDEQLLRVHTPEYVRAIESGEPRALAESQKFPWSPGLDAAVRLTNGGVVAAAEAALEDGVAASLSSGYHHAHADHGEGFCTFNGLVVAYEHLRERGRADRVLVLDLDLHYGNGTASLARRRPQLFNLSIYGSWYEDNRASADVTSRSAPDTENCRSVAVPNGTDGEGYLELLDEHLGPALDWARPDLVLYQAGADPFAGDPYSALELTVDDLERRDRWVFERLRERGVPVAFVLAGGYTDPVDVVVDIHVHTVRAALEVFAAR